MSAEHDSNKQSYFQRGLRAIGRIKPSQIATVAAAVTMTAVMLTGMLDGAEKRLSDAWFAASHRTPSGRTVLVTFDHHAARYAYINRVPHRDLAELLLKLDAAGASRILIEFGFAEQTNEADDKLLERVLTQLGPKVALPAIAVPSVNQMSWRRTAPLDRFGRHVTLTASDLAPDSDGSIRKFGIQDSGLRYLISAPAWLTAATRLERSFRIDFGIDLQEIPHVDALSFLQGDQSGRSLQGANVIVAGFISPTGGEFRVPRYGELTSAQITALAAETLSLGRELRSIPRSTYIVGLIVLAALMAFWCTNFSAPIGGGLCAGVALAALGLGVWLQTFVGLTTPSAGVVLASLIGYGAAQVIVHPALQRVRHAVMTILANIDIRLARAVENTSDGLLTFDRDGTLLSINAAARQLFGIEGSNLYECSLTSMLGLQARAVMSAVSDPQQRRVRTVIRQHGIERHLELAVSGVPGDGTSIGVATVRDVTEQHAQFETMRLIATRDPLTGLANRRAFEQALKSARGDSEALLALFICDLDGFKPVNDTWGHQTGDALLREIASRLVAHAGAQALVARLGGDEFGILMPRSTEALATEAAKRIIGAVGRPFEIDGKWVHVGVSIGVALGESNQDGQALIECADAAMYDAKRAHSGCAFWRGKPVPHATAQPISRSSEVSRLYSPVG